MSGIERIGDGRRAIASGEGGSKGDDNGLETEICVDDMALARESASASARSGHSNRTARVGRRVDLRGMDDLRDDHGDRASEIVRAGRIGPSSQTYLCGCIGRDDVGRDDVASESGLAFRNDTGGPANLIVPLATVHCEMALVISHGAAANTTSSASGSVILLDPQTHPPSLPLPLLPSYPRPRDQRSDRNRQHRRKYRHHRRPAEGWAPSF